ncbi:CYTH and CHAD domain-containing protein [Kutzneria sp. CA-103260]|uniref:CYTH and CHAD domain-containing protein n=1 Tax=Kutzneria sp. CA-103260 TaxID=2802641 RepID=UPI001BAB482B|nr:CHAD domain-containing protein [Kutzneria sp. CA-103260]QUQ62888.1 CYTH and CHAD domain-containing protein [Kutzneria sp. CA-103260]
MDAGRLAGVPGLDGGEEILLDAVYHDTANLRLARRGVTLRRRTGGADEEVFDAVERRLGRPSDAPPKLVRLLGDRLLKRGQPPNAIAAYVQRQVEEMGRQDIRIRQGGEDSVHQLRVASRRIRSVLQAYRGSRWLIKELRWLGGVLAPARDLEVLREHLQAEVAALPSELALGNVRQRLTETFAPREQQARDEVLRTLKSDRYFALLNRLDAVRIKPVNKKKRLRKTKSRVWNNGTLHDVRKAAKRARYAAEASRKPKLARRLKKLQKQLGVHQDSVVARQELRAMGIQSHLDGDSAFTYGLLYGCELRRAELVEESLPRKRKV